MRTVIYLVIIASMSIIKGSTVTIKSSATGCHNSIIILNCTGFDQSNTGHSLRWRIKDPVSTKWENLALIRRGRTRVLSSSQRYFGDRLTLHGNGSLAIKSLKEHDETHYQCIVSARGKRDNTLIKLDVACNGTPSKENKDACTGDDILLDCLARHRTNPRNLHRVIWHQQKTVELSQVVARSGGPVKDNYTLHQNGSLLVPGILSNVNTSIVFRCTVTKNKRTLPRERHTVFIRFVQCAKQEVQTTITTTKDSIAMTTNSPITGSTVVKGTRTPTLSSTPASDTQTRPQSFAPLTQTTHVTMETTPAHVTTHLPSTQATSTTTKYHATIKTTKGRVAMTTRTSIQGTTVAMEKTTSVRAAMTTSTPFIGTTVAMEKTPSQHAAMATSTSSHETTVATETTSSEPSTQSTTPTKESHVCGGSLTSVSGGFKSPNFPSSYPANSYCKWTISVPKDYAAIDITLDNMSLEHEENCQNDYIAMTDELGNQVGCRQCGSYSKPITFEIRGRVAVVEFMSNSIEQKTGFQLSYKSKKKYQAERPLNKTTSTTIRE